MGALVISFDCAAAVAEGDLTTYMSHFASLHPIMPRYNLRRDTQQWGITDKLSTSVYYVLWPPWVPRRVRFGGSMGGKIPKSSKGDL